MSPEDVLPILGPDEVYAFARRIPVALDESGFADLVLGFPRRYLEATPALDVLKHYALMRGLGTRVAISSIAREGDGYRVCVVARDRHALFSRIAGSLTCFGLNIVSAEAFANANQLVLDRFDCGDPGGRLEKPDERRSFQAFLENAIAGGADLEAMLRGRLPSLGRELDSLLLEFDDEAHPTATRMRLQARDRTGLLYVVSEALARLGCDIELAYVATTGDHAHDEFFISREGRKLLAHEREAVRAALSSGDRAADAA